MVRITGVNLSKKIVWANQNIGAKGGRK